MAINLLVIGSVFLIISFGIHGSIMAGNKLTQPLYVHNPFLSTIPLIGGLVLPVVAWCYLFDFHWLLIAIANAVVVFISGPFLTRHYLHRFASGKGFEKDMFIAFLIGITLYTIGLIMV